MRAHCLSIVARTDLSRFWNTLKFIANDQQNLSKSQNSLTTNNQNFRKLSKDSKAQQKIVILFFQAPSQRPVLLRRPLLHRQRRLQQDNESSRLGEGLHPQRVHHPASGQPQVATSGLIRGGHL